jgi:hypothetical protein
MPSWRCSNGWSGLRRHPSLKHRISLRISAIERERTRPAGRLSTPLHLEMVAGQESSMGGVEGGVRDAVKLSIRLPCRAEAICYPSSLYP